MFKRFFSSNYLNKDQIDHNQAIRKMHLDLRAQLIGINKSNYDDKICQHVKQFVKKHNFQTMGFYWSTKNEVDTIALINFYLHDSENQIKIFLPQVVSRKKMVFCKIESLDFPSNTFKTIKQPTKKAIKILPQNLNVIFVPMVAYDQNKNRLGYGAGYYDRYLKKMKKYNCIIVGLAYTVQKTNLIYCHPQDIAMDLIINETGEF